MPLSDAVPVVTFSRLLNSDSEVCQTLNQVVEQAIWKIGYGQSIWRIRKQRLVNQINFFLKDPKEENFTKFLEVCLEIDRAVKLNDLSASVTDKFCNLIKTEALDFVWQEIKTRIRINSSEILIRFRRIAQWLNKENIKPSPLRDLLNELKNVALYCARKNQWPIPTGVNKILNLLRELAWKKDEELPQLLNDCHRVIIERLKYSYIVRDETTYFLYRNFNFILTRVSDNNFDIIVKKINSLNEFLLEKRKEETNVFINFHLFLLEVKGKVDMEHWNNKGKTLGIFSNKPPDGIWRLRRSFNKFPANLPFNNEDKIQIIKIFMQIKEILTEKKLSTERPFRDTAAKEFYRVLGEKIQAIYKPLSIEDSDLFCVVDLKEGNNKEIVDSLAIPQGYVILSNPENIHSVLDKIGELFEPDKAIGSQPSCSNG